MKRFPKTIAIIPARGGSKRLPRKNLLSLCGVPLVARTIGHALAARAVSEVYVSTDDAKIAAAARGAGADVIRRPRALAGDRASSESALLHALNERNRRGLPDPELVVFLQCTSPARRAGDIDAAVRTLVRRGADSLFSCCRSRKFLWKGTRRGPEPLNYDFRRRPREQEIDQFEENGSIYVFRPRVLRRFKNRLGGKMAIYEMDPWSSFQLDTPDDARLLEWIIARGDSGGLRWPGRVKLVVFDFDGVMTDNTAALSGNGRESVRVSRGDGLGIGLLRKAGVPMIVLSKETDPVVSSRCAKLKLPCFQGVGEKEAFLKKYLAGARIDPANVVYVGNDVNDIGCLKLVGLPVAVAGAHPAVFSEARLVLSRPGGRGAVREFCDRLLAHLGRHPG